MNKTIESLNHELVHLRCIYLRIFNVNEASLVFDSIRIIEQQHIISYIRFEI